MPTKYPTVKRIILVESREDAEVRVYFDCDKPESGYRYEAEYEVLDGAGILKIVRSANWDKFCDVGRAHLDELDPAAIDHYLAQK
jgi:hypothetical protein